MNPLNSILIEGFVVRDAQTRETPSGATVTTYQIASNRYYKNNDEYIEETSFLDIETWSKLADICATKCLKGQGVRVVGRLKQDRWTGADGKHYSKVKIIAEHVEFKPNLKMKQVEEQESGEGNPEE